MILRLFIQMVKNNFVYIKQILDYISDIEDFTRNIQEENFLSNKLVQFAVIRCYEVIGEAVKKIDPDFRKKYDQVPWKYIAGLRDILIHNYEGVNPASVWETTIKDLPIFKAQLLQIRADES